MIAINLNSVANVLNLTEDILKFMIKLCTLVSVFPINPLGTKTNSLAPMFSQINIILFRKRSYIHFAQCFPNKIISNLRQVNKIFNTMFT